MRERLPNTPQRVLSDVMYVAAPCPNKHKDKHALQQYINVAMWRRKARIVFSDQTVVEVSKLRKQRSHGYSARIARKVSNEPITSKQADIYKTFPGLRGAANEFVDFKVLDYVQDGGYGCNHVYVLLIRFEYPFRTICDGYGLCVWNAERKAFIEEPGNLNDYETTLQSVVEQFDFKL